MNNALGRSGSILGNHATCYSFFLLNINYPIRVNEKRQCSTYNRDQLNQETLDVDECVYKHMMYQG